MDLGIFMRRSDHLVFLSWPGGSIDSTLTVLQGIRPSDSVEASIQVL